MDVILTYSSLQINKNETNPKQNREKNYLKSISLSRFSRSDIAERLHNVIETQWQKTLEILTTNDASKDLNKLCSNRIVNDLEKCEKNKCSGS